MIARILLAALMLGSMAFAAEQAPKSEAPAAALPMELIVDVPSGWSRQQDPSTRAIYMKPPNARTVNESALVVFPAIAFAGTAEQFHHQTLATAVGQRRMLEPVQQAKSKTFMVSAVRCANAQGAEAWMVLYTARWGTRAQAIVFAADRKDLFESNAAAANAALLKVAIPKNAASPPAEEAGSMISSDASSTTVAPASRSVATSDSSADRSIDAGDSMPVLEYTDPPNFFRGASGGNSYAEYQGSDVNFTLCVYPFKEFDGNIRATFQQTLLRDWIGVMYREEGIAGPPQFTTFITPGADANIGAKFLDARQQEHFRILILAGHWAAMVDMIAPTAFAWQKGFSSAVHLLDSMRVGKKPAPPSVAGGPGPEGARLAGLFQGTKGKTVSNLMLGPGYLSTQLALHYFLFSADGRVFRCYDFPPGGNENAARHFDFDAAERQDPGNTGRYAVRGNELYIKMGGPNADEITTTLADPNSLQLDSISYVRKQ